MRTCSGDAGQENDDLTGMTAAVQRICLSNEKLVKTVKVRRKHRDKKIGGMQDGSENVLLSV